MAIGIMASSGGGVRKNVGTMGKAFHVGHGVRAGIYAAFLAQDGFAVDPDIIEGAVAKKIRALWVIATNPVVSFPNLGVLQQSLDSLDFLVVQDGFHPTPTTEVADLILPAAIWGGKGRHLHEFGAARQQSQSGRRAAK
jgi:anaerobic selenocysteine-containing dehydrogenase